MHRRIGQLCALALVVVLPFGCSAYTDLMPGEDIRVQNGVTITVPEGWRGKHLRGDVEAASGVTYIEAAMVNLPDQNRTDGIEVAVYDSNESLRREAILMERMSRVMQSSTWFNMDVPGGKARVLTIPDNVGYPVKMEALVSIPDRLPVVIRVQLEPGQTLVDTTSSPQSTFKSVLDAIDWRVK